MAPLARFRHPGQLVLAAFVGTIAVGTGLLMLPWSTASGTSPPLLDAAFTSTSAVCVTGLVTVDTGSYWSGFGQGVILVLIQVGGLGIMVVATLLALAFARRMGLRARFALQTETRSTSPGQLRRLVLRIVAFSLVAEAVVAVLLGLRLWLGYDQTPGAAAYSGLFHAVSAFNNAGFSIYSDSLMGFVSDPWFLLPVCAAVVLGGLGFPVVFELARSAWHPHSWSILTRITVAMTVVLLVGGTVFFMFEEINNPNTLQDKGLGTASLAAFATSTMARTAGFNVLDIGAMDEESLFATDVLMFIGGGSAGTAGGVKVTTIGLLAFVVWSEMRGRDDVEVGHRRVSAANQRQALTVAVLGMSVVVVAAFGLLLLSDVAFNRVVFETVSAFGTVGLSTGLTPELSDPAQALLAVVMLIGRVGPLTAATSLALRERASRRRLPEERMIVG